MRPGHATVGRMRILAGLLLGLLLLPACAGRTAREPIYQRNRIEVQLRSQKTWVGKPIDQGFQHPASISAGRLSNILSAIDVQMRGREKGALREQRAALHPEILRGVITGLAQAFEQADSTQELVVMAVRKEQRLGLFHRKFLTSFVAYLRDNYLHLHFSRIDWRIPKDKESDDLHEPRQGKRLMDFRAIAARGMHTAGTQTIVVPWRHRIYALPLRKPSKTGGAEHRRTILMESPISPDEQERFEAVPADLSGTTLRALADLEDARRDGTITESEYRKRRAALVGEPGY